MKIAISAETTVDLTKEIIDRVGVNIIPFSIQLGDRSGLDGEITADEIISYVTKTGVLPKTSAVNEFSYDEHFEKLLKEYDAVIHFSLSSDLSLACINAKRSASKFKNVFVVDSRSLSTGIALLVLYAKKLIDNGVSVEEVFDKCVERTSSVQASFVLKRLDYLHKGGRCSSIALLGANLLKIRPQIIVKDGKMISGKKYRGSFDHVVKNYCNDLFETYTDCDYENVFLTYTTAEPTLIENVKNYLLQKGFRNVYITRAGGTITSHCGENCLGVLFMNK